MRPSPNASSPPPSALPRLGPFRKLVVGLGDHTITVALAALSFFYLFYLSEEIGLRPILAGAVLMVGRAADAISDPLMGRISDRTRLAAGRRRPYLLWGALPFGASFAALWIDVGFTSQLGMFAYYASAYVVFSICSTVVAVPYTALIPELVEDYQERTSLNSWRSGLAVLGTLVAALAIPPLRDAFGGGTTGYVAATSILALWIALPWLGVYAVSTERTEFQQRATTGLWAGTLQLLRHQSYRQLSGLYICGRISMDIAGAVLLFYLTYWLMRPEDFGPILATVMITAVASLPIWLWLSRRIDKKTAFITGCLLWLGVQPVLLLAQPEWPIIIVFAACFVMGFGYSVVDMMPWSMVGEVIDEDELRHGERREGLYAGYFTFIRKLGGALAVWMAGAILDLAGLRAGEAQSDTVLWAVRLVTSLGPAVFLVLAIGFAIPYKLGRQEHGAILAALEERRAPDS